MPSMSPLPQRRAAVLLLALLASGCATVDLGPRYDPPPVRLPQALPPAPPPTAPVAQTQAVPPSLPVPQPLPPVDQSSPLPPPAPGSGPAVAEPAPLDPRAHLVTLSTRMDGASVLPPTRSAASAQLDALYDSSTRVLRWKTTWSGLSGAITGVRFHAPGLEGQEAPAVMLWPGPFGPTYEGRATLTANQAVDLLDGRWYVVVSTTAYPAGELRGQLRVVH